MWQLLIVALLQSEGHTLIPRIFAYSFTPSKSTDGQKAEENLQARAITLCLDSSFLIPTRFKVEDNSSQHVYKRIDMPKSWLNDDEDNFGRENYQRVCIFAVCSRERNYLDPQTTVIATLLQPGQARKITCIFLCNFIAVFFPSFSFNPRSIFPRCWLDGQEDDMKPFFFPWWNARDEFKNGVTMSWGEIKLSDSHWISRKNARNINVCAKHVLEEACKHSFSSRQFRKWLAMRKRDRVSHRKPWNIT